MSEAGRAAPTQWVGQLLMGARLAVTGGRAGWARTLLTALGVAFGVAVLLIAASVPAMTHAQETRTSQRTITPSPDTPASDRTLLISRLDTEFRGQQVSGHALQPDGDPALAVRPPGVDRLPEPGTMLVSPALRELLSGPDGQELWPRFEGTRIAGTVGDQGLRGPNELLFYLGSDDLEDKLASEGAHRVDRFGVEGVSDELATELVVLVVVMVVVLLMPIAAFVTAAVRFGGERRDQRLAALRLVGADSRMTRRIAAGEVLVGATLGLLLGGVLFLLGRPLAHGVQLYRVDVFPSDLSPEWALTALIVVLVPASAVVVTLLALRKVVVSPLGVAREGADRGRRLWWRLAITLIGLASLFLHRSGNENGMGENWLLGGSLLLALSGVVSLLPWAVEYVVNRLRGGGLSWQLATRRLQLNAGVAARAVSGVVTAVAGAVALQMLLGAVDVVDRETVGMPEFQANEVFVTAQLDNGRDAARRLEAIESVEGIDSAHGYLSASVVPDGAEEDDGGTPTRVPVVIADCPTLRGLLSVDSCAKDDVFYVADASSRKKQREPAAGDRYHLDGTGDGAASSASGRWVVPEKPKPADLATGAFFYDAAGGFYLAPSAMSQGELGQLSDVSVGAWVDVPPDDAGAIDRIRNLSPLAEDPTAAYLMSSAGNSEDFQEIKSALMAGSVVVMLLIACSMLLSTVDQLRERRRQLAVLVAFGVKRSTLAASVLWQTAIPMVLGLSLAVLGGLSVGLLLVRMVGRPVADWWAFLPLAGVGLGAIVLVTLASLPVLWRLMRPDGLRTE